MDITIAILVLVFMGGITFFSYQKGIAGALNNSLTPVFVVTNNGQTLYFNPGLNHDNPALASSHLFSRSEMTALNPRFVLFLQKVREEHSFNYQYDSLISHRSYTLLGQRIWYKGKWCWQVSATPDNQYESALLRSADNKVLLHNIIQDIPDAIGMMNEELIYEACNPPFVKALGIDSPDQLLGRKLEDVASQDVAGKFAYSDRNVLETGREFHIIDEVEDETGSKIWMEARKFLYTDPVSGSKGLFIIARDITEAEQAKERLKQTKNEFKRLSLIDSLTGIGNRRYFDECLSSVWKQHVNANEPVTLMLCDIDEFKKLNDSKGHGEGDKALVSVARVLEQTIAETEYRVFRIGGEEFAFILSKTDELKAASFSQRIHQQIDKLNYPHENSPVKSQLTVSIGSFTTIPAASDSITDAMEAVDKALYKAKANGKDQTVYAA